jgi:hypothetical protein
MTREVTPEEVLDDLLGSADFPVAIVDTKGAARIILRRLEDSGFEVCAVGVRMTTPDLGYMFDLILALRHYGVPLLALNSPYFTPQEWAWIETGYQLSLGELEGRS